VKLLQNDTIIRLEHILFDLHLGIREAVKIKFIDHEQLEKYIEILKEQDCIDDTNKGNIFFKYAECLIIFGKNYKVKRKKLTFIASCVDVGAYTDYIQIGENRFVRP